MARKEVRNACQKRYLATPNGKAKNRANQKRYRDKGRLTCLTYYCDGTPHCQCECGCGVTTLEFLGIDHIDGGGRAHRIAIRGSGTLYHVLKKQGYPAGFRVLCHNCNLAKGFYGRCPNAPLTTNP